MIAVAHTMQLPLPPTPSAEEEVLLNLAREAGDAAARERLILGHLRLVFYLARRYAWQGASFEDLVHEGVAGLIRAIDTFDHRRGRLATLAAFHIRRALLEHLAANRTIMRLPLSAYADIAHLVRAERELADGPQRAADDPELVKLSGLSPRRIKQLRAALGSVASLDLPAEAAEGEGLCGHELLADPSAEDPHVPADHALRGEQLRAAVKSLPARVRWLVERYYGLDGLPPAPLKELAAHCGISPSRVRHLLAAAIARLRRTLPAAAGPVGTVEDALNHASLRSRLRGRGRTGRSRDDDRTPGPG